jgi:hypothetical protein
MVVKIEKNILTTKRGEGILMKKGCLCILFPLLKFVFINIGHNLLILIFQLHVGLQVLVNRFGLNKIFYQGDLSFRQCLL